MTKYTIFRCETCGKWSHAKRKPSFHTKMEKSLNAIGYSEYGEVFYDYDEVKCGPFKTYIAVSVEDD